jgi:predicted transcriptional regulator of viral defense system
VSASRYADLKRLNVRTITTPQAAAAWHISGQAASKALSSLATAGLVESLRRGIWLIDLEATAEMIAEDVTAPHPAYVSHVSALYSHGVIDQVPAALHLASSGESGTVHTSRGDYLIHHLPPVLFGGFQDIHGAKIATVEKALFDWAYVSVASGNLTARLPETEWPERFRRAEVDRWLNRIEISRLRTLTERLVSRRLG